VDALPALERAHDQRADHSAGATRLPKPAGIVAALRAREPHPPQLSQHDLQIAQREARDRDQRARHTQPVGAVQDLRRGRRPCQYAGGQHRQRRLGEDTERQPPAVLGRERQDGDEHDERRLDREPAGQQRERRAGGDGDHGEQRHVHQVRPDHMTTRDERHGHDEQHRRQHLALRGRAVQRRLDGRLDLLVVRGPAHSRLPRPPRCAGRITVEKYGAAPSGGIKVWPARPSSSP
jgi:hypothetical protein